MGIFDVEYGNLQIKWHAFEIPSLSKDREYMRLATRAYYCASRYVGENCTQFTSRFLGRDGSIATMNVPVGNGKTKKVPIDLDFGMTKYAAGRLHIGPADDGQSYTHHAVGIIRKGTQDIVAVFDPIENAPLGQANCKKSTANNRYSLDGWLSEKTRLKHSWKQATTGFKIPFCVFLFNSVYAKGTVHNYSWVVKDQA